jgi:putative transposase
MLFGSNRISEITKTRLLNLIGIYSSKYYEWVNREGQPNKHNGIIPKLHWILPWESLAIIAYAKAHTGEGYRRLTYMMIDDNIFAVSPSTTYRVLKNAGLLSRWNKIKDNKKGRGFDQPTEPHKHWHTDIKYVNFKGTFLFLICVIDGYSVHHELRTTQFISKDFVEYPRQVGLTHIKTSIAYPQANGKIERFHGSFHQECEMRQSFFDLNDARKRVSSYINFYNSKRLHSSLFYLTPEDFLFGRIEDKINVRKEKLALAKAKRIEVKIAS